MDKAILSFEYPEFSERLRELGYYPTDSERVKRFISYEQDHADMQCLVIEDTAFVLKDCRRLSAELQKRYRVIVCGEHIQGKYPANIPLNVCVIGSYMIGKLDSVDKNVLRFCKEREYHLINVSQGYAKCACAVVSDNALITEDNGIYCSLKETKIDVLKIREGRVGLVGASCGLIGGASGYHNHKLFFTGNIERHPDYPTIKTFCDLHHTEMVSLSDGELTDIGGIIFC